jgi:hypothetical protein
VREQAAAAARIDGPVPTVGMVPFTHWNAPASAHGTCADHPPPTETVTKFSLKAVADGAFAGSTITVTVVGVPVATPRAGRAGWSR